MTLHQDQPILWTYQDYCHLPDDGQRYEVIEGVLYMSPSPNSLHQLLSRRLQFFFYQFELEQQGYIYDAPMDLIMPGCSPVQPDLIFLDRDQRSLILEARIEGVPLLLAEIISPSHRAHDRVRKLNRYAQSGVPYYLLIDPQESTLEVLIHHQGRYLMESCLTQEQQWTFRGKTLDLQTFFAPL